MIERGSPAFWRVSLALFAAGLATFALLYCVQPLMPVFSAEFGVGAAASSVSLSVTTMALALALLPAGALSDRLGRKSVMVASLLASSILCGVCALAPGFAGIVATRALMGLALAGLPAIAMAYVSEEMAPQAAGLGMGLYIGGSAIGGMVGRLVAALAAQEFGWRAAFGIIAAGCLLCGASLWRFLPRSANFTPRPLRWQVMMDGVAGHLRHPILPFLFAEAFLLMGGFVSIYNYLGYRLLAAPYKLSQAQAGLIFLVYPIGVVSSAGLGGLALRSGRLRVMTAAIGIMAAGVALTLLRPVPIVILGVAGVTAGFFGAHSVASAWVGAAAVSARAQASGLYLLAYYAGSSLVGSATGLVWAGGGWNAVAGAVAVVLACALCAARLMPRETDLGAQSGVV